MGPKRESYVRVASEQQLPSPFIPGQWFCWFACLALLWGLGVRAD